MLEQAVSSGNVAFVSFIFWPCTGKMLVSVKCRAGGEDMLEMTEEVTAGDVKFEQTDNLRSGKDILHGEF